MKKHLFLFSSLLFVLLACVKPVKIIIPEAEDKLVVNGLLFKDTLLNIHVRKTQPILGDLDTNAIEEYKQAKVKLYENNILIDSALYKSYLDTFVTYRLLRPKVMPDSVIHLAPQNNIQKIVGIRNVEGYVFPHYIPKANTHYKVEVSSPDYPTASAETYMPSPPKISNVQINIHANIQDLYSQSYLTFDLEDDANERNYYFVKVKGYWHWNNPLDSYMPTPFKYYTEQKMPIFGNDNYEPVLSGDINTLKSRDYVAIKDANFNGQKKQISLMLRTNYKRKNSNRYFDYERFVVTVYSVSEEYFEYMEKFNLVRKLGLDLGVLDATPVIMPNSVQNGYGLLGGYVLAKDSVMW